MARRDLDVSDAILRGNLVRRLAGVEAPKSGAQASGRPLIVAHRGNSARAPENTLTAVQSAFAIGADLVEVDVRLSRDGVPIVIHNDRLEETTDGSGLVASKTLAELKRYDAGYWKDPRFAGERIPSFEEVLDASRGRGRLLIDVNAPGLAQPIARAYRRLGVADDDAVVGAWNDEQIGEFVREMPRALILHSSGAPDHRNFSWFRTIGVRGFEVGEEWPMSFMRGAHAAGMVVFAYTINDEGTMRRLIRMGVDAIETDDPELAIAVRDATGPRIA